MVFAVVAFILFLDQLTKFLITKNLFYNQSVPVIKGVFHFTLVHNRGAAFGILKNQVPFFIIASILAIVLISLSLKEKRHSRNYIFFLSLILAGAIGNLIDRLTYGYVIDFLDFRIWPVFNIADSAITVGAVLLGLSLLKLEKKGVPPRHNVTRSQED